MKRLVELGVPISIWGDNWKKSSCWQVIKGVWRGPGIHTADYAKPLLGARICLGLLNAENRDLPTKRSIEIPALDRLLCAQRTTEHLMLYEERKEAFFWDTAEECAEICMDLLHHPEVVRQVARRGHQRCLRNNLFNEPVLASIIKRVMDN